MPRTTDQRSSPSGPRSGARINTAVIPAGTAGTAAVTLMTCPLTGALTTDLVVVSPLAALKANINFGCCRIPAANQLAVYVTNPTAAQITVGNITCNVHLIRYPARRP